MIDVDQLDDFPPERIVVISTGSQGEPMAALTRMAMNEHRPRHDRAGRYGHHLGHPDSGQ